MCALACAVVKSRMHRHFFCQSLYATLLSRAVIRYVIGGTITCLVTSLHAANVVDIVVDVARCLDILHPYSCSLDMIGVYLT